MWALIIDNGLNWVNLIIDMMIYYRDNPKRAFFFSLFVQMILEINGIASKEAALVEAPKILDESVISKMRYYRDSKGDYYYLEQSGRKIYDDKVVEPTKDPFVKAIGSS